MTWDPKNVRVGSYKGVEFPFVQSMSTQRSKRYRSVEYTNRPGGQVWDGARRPVTINLTAMFGLVKLEGIATPAFGNDWRKQMRELIKVCDEVGPGNLVHPVYGDIWCLCTSYPDEIRGDVPNQGQMRLSFIEAAHGEQAWQNVVEILNPEARAETLASTMDAALGFEDSASFSFHAGAFLAVLLLPTMTLQLMESSLAAAVQAIISLADTIDVSTNPLHWDYVGDAYRLTGMLVEAAELYTGQRSSLKIYSVQRDMTLLDVAAECSCDETEVLQYNEVPDPLEIRKNTLLIVPA